MNHLEDSACSDTRRKLIAAAREAFTEDGYRASVDSIAARAGVAKQTLYNHFPRKEDLFIEVVGSGSASVVVSLEDEGEELRKVLIHFAVAFRKRAMARDSLTMFRILTAEIHRLTELTRAFYAKGPLQTKMRLSAFLDSAMRRGELRREDPGFAAEMLIGMLLGGDFIRSLCAMPPLEGEENGRCQQIVDCFLRAFAPQA